MSSIKNTVSPDTDRWIEIASRYRRAREAMFQAQQQNCTATCEFLAARAEVRQLLESVFPEPNISDRAASV